jgi:hypothetical protein
MIFPLLPSLILLTVFITALVSIPAKGQSGYGSLTGSVTDPAGVVIAGVSIRLTDADTNDSRSTVTNGSGDYIFGSLIPGRYELDLQKDGYQRVVQKAVIVRVQTTIRVNVALQIGEVIDSVEVSTKPEILQSESGSLASIIEGREVEQAPLNGRNVMNLVTLVPGVVAGGTSQGNAAVISAQGWGNYQFGGGISNQGATFFDGVLLNTNYANQPALIPSQDLVREFSVSTNSTSAEYGNTAGGVVNLVSRSGTNHFHGSVFEFLRNKILNANLFFNKRTDTPRPAFTQNQYGATIGGPVLHNRVFFFGSWEGFALRQGNRYIGSVPTDAERGGNFSASGLLPIYDPCAGSVTADGLCSATPPTKTQFSGNAIPSNRLNSTAIKLLQLWPHANLATATPVNNFTRGYSTGANYNQYGLRGDYTFSSRQSFWGRYSDWRSQRLPTDSLGTNTGSVISFRSKQAAIGETIVVNPTTLIDYHIAFTRFETGTLPQAAGADQTAFDLPASYNSELNRGYPSPCVTGVFTQFCSTNLDLTITGANNNFEIVSSLTRSLGRHTIKAGLSLRDMQFNFSQSNYGSGFFNFDTAFTGNGTGTGDSFASFLLGYFSRSSASATTGIQQGKPTAAEQLYQGYYVADTYQLSSRITVTAGLRWDIPTFWKERHDSLNVLLPNSPSPLASSFVDPVTGAQISLRGEMALVDSPQYTSRYQMDVHHDLFAPRLGVSFRVGRGTVLRSGFGIFFLPAGVSFLSAPANSPLNTVITNPVFSTGSVPVASLSDPFPGGIAKPGGHSQSFLDSLYGKSINAVVPHQSYPYEGQWNVAVQQQVGDTASLEIAYAGGSGVHLPNSVQLNVLPLAALNQSAAQSSSGSAVTIAQTVVNPLAALMPSAKSTTNYGELLLPFPQYLAVTNTQSQLYHSSYHSLQPKFDKRFGYGGNLLVSYTWSKLLSNTDTQSTYLESTGFSNNGGLIQNSLNPRGERSLSAGNIPQRLVVSYTIDLPFGANRAFLSHLAPSADRLVAGWGVDGITQFQSGFPLTIIQASTPAALQPYNFSAVRPNVVASCSKVSSGSAFQRVNSGSWFNKACFSATAPYTLGNQPRVDPTLKQQGFKNFDLALFKNTAITDSMSVEFRVEAFNIFNTTRFSAPNVSFGSAAFGTVTKQGNDPRLIQFGLRMKF